MNFAHIHLILNHIPVIGIPIALIFLIHGFWSRNNSVQRISLIVLVALAVLALPVYFTGEPAEDVVEKLPGISKTSIELHEDAATPSLVLTILTGVSALSALYLQRYKPAGQWAVVTVMGVAGLATVSLLYTANLGGKVQHSEIQSQ